MRFGFQHVWLDRRSAAHTIVGLAALYALLALLLQLLALAFGLTIDIPGWDVDSPVEVCTALVELGGLAFAAMQVYRHRSAATLRSGWSFAVVGMALIATSETADWFTESAPFWNEELWFEMPLWLIAAWCIRQCTRLYGARPGVGYWFRVGVLCQLVSAALEVAKAGLAPMPLIPGDMLEVAIDYAALLCLLCYVSALGFAQVGATVELLTRRLPGMLIPAPAGVGACTARAGAPVEIGTLARTMFFDQGMFRAARYPTRYAFLHRPGMRQAVTLAMAAFFGGRIGPCVRRAGARSLLRQASDLLRMGLAQGIDAVSYYLFELYRPQGDAEAPYYLTRYETKNGLLTVLNAVRPRQDGVPHDLTDKAVFGRACEAAGLPTPPILLTAQDGTIEHHAPVGALDRDLFAKLMRGRGTAKTGRFRRIAPLTYVDRGGETVSLSEIAERIRRQSLTVVGRKTTPVIVQPCLRNHASLADLAHDSLVVIRVVTCLDRADAPEVTHAMLRILAKIEPDWDARPDSEFGAAIDLESGRLGWLTGDRPDSCLDWHRSHPVTGAPVLGRRIDAWPALRDLALRGHRLFRNRIVIGWDLALTTGGAMVLEGNSNMDVSFIQRAYRDPIGRSRLGELLAWHLSRLDRHRPEPAP